MATGMRAKRLDDATAPAGHHNRAEVDLLLGRLPFVNLQPGEMVMTDKPTLITTLLGSCVSVCLHGPEKQIGAMCHCLLPSHQKNGGQDPLGCIDSCIDHMVATLNRRYGLKPDKLRAKLFGGANVLQAGVGFRNANRGVGRQNIEAARAALRAHGLKVVVEKVGGEHGYKLFFNSQTGEVFMRRVRIAAATAKRWPAKIDGLVTKPKTALGLHTFNELRAEYPLESSCYDSNKIEKAAKTRRSPSQITRRNIK